MSAYKLTRRLPRYLREIQIQVEEVARAYGLDCFPTIFEVVAYDQMNELAAYGGFPVRYPHWRFGMEYEQLSKSSEYGLSKIYEMVINNSPAIAYLLEGNSLVDQKLVMAHVYAHVDFFKNNFSFKATDQGTDQRTGEPIRKWIDTMANHGAIVRRWADRVGIERVEEYIDACLSLENLIDPQKPFLPPKRRADENEEVDPLELALLRVDRDYMESYINPQEFVDQQREKAEAERERAKRIPEHPDRDVLGFLLDHAPLERWERDLLAVVRREAYYFWPQMQTKIMNEGWACVDPSTLVFTDAGLVAMRDVVEGRAGVVSDGEAPRRVYDQHVIADHETVTIRTRRGLALTGSNNHRIMLPDGSWARLDALAVGDSIRVSGGADLWPTETLPIAWDPPRRISLDDAAAEAEVSVWTVLRHRAGASTQRAEAVARALEPYEAPENQRLPQAVNKRRAIRVPARLDAELGAFLGYLVGDGHISKKKRQLGLTTGDEAQAERFAQLLVSLFDVRPSTKLDGGRWRVLAHAEMLSDFLVETLGLTTGPSAREKRIPDAVLRSPEPIVRAFLTAYFDCDGYAGKQGVILSSASQALITQTQLLLLNYGILSRARSQTDGTFHLHVTGASAKRFEERVGFGLERKQEALAEYLAARKHFKRERWEDAVVSVEHGRGEVWDISVESTHRYAAAGFVNHNSYWHSRLMTEKLSDDSEIIEYAERNASVLETGSGRLNPYKLGVELYRHIEERWDRGQFGKEWEDCETLEARQAWDRRTGLGRKKIFEVRSLYNDVTFIDEFLTPEFVAAQKLYTFGYNQRNDRYEIESRKFFEVKNKLLFSLTNAGQPFIRVVDKNHENRGELLLAHEHQGVDLRIDWAKEVLGSLVRVWRRPVEIHTMVDNKPTLLRFDGKEHVQRPLK
ncbi:MAG: SpoVR family protein [Sandaracinaceae bacterium]|nr:SpoVR family protein [Sandaracinaceae bacterium]